jgi:hypothetical protein
MIEAMQLHRPVAGFALRCWIRDRLVTERCYFVLVLREAAETCRSDPWGIAYQTRRSAGGDLMQQGLFEQHQDGHWLGKFKFA